MAQNWNFFFLKVDDRPASIMVDLNLSESAPDPAHPVVVALELTMATPRPDGLSSQEEYETLIAIEVALEEAAEGSATYAGRHTGCDKRHFYFYGADAPQLVASLSATMTGWPDYAFETWSRSDPEWSVYRDFLYPGREDLERMANRDVLQRLEDDGDDLDAERQVDYFAAFPSEPAQGAFLSSLAAKGFTLHETFINADGEFQVEFHRMDRPRAIDTITIDLLREADRHGGTFGGWGCPTVK